MAKAVAAIADGGLGNIRLFAGEAQASARLAAAGFRAIASIFSIPIRGRRSATGSAASSRRRISPRRARAEARRRLPRCQRHPVVRRVDADARRTATIAWHGPPNAPPIGWRRSRRGRARATRRRRSPPAVRRPTSPSPGCEPPYTRSLKSGYPSAMITQKAKYAFKALFHLAEQPDGASLQIEEIARGAGVRGEGSSSTSCLDLKRKGIVESPPRPLRRLRSGQAPGRTHHRHHPCGPSMGRSRRSPLHLAHRPIAVAATARTRRPAPSAVSLPTPTRPTLLLWESRDAGGSPFAEGVQTRRARDLISRKATSGDSFFVRADKNRHACR